MLAAVSALVLVFDPGGMPAGLIEALRIQFAGTAEISLGPALPQDSLREKLAKAHARVAASHSRMGLWVESSTLSPDRELVLFVVGTRADRLFAEMVAVTSSSDLDVERAAALKIREIFDSVPAAAETAPPPIEHVESRYGLSIEAGAVGAVGAGYFGGGGRAAIGAQLEALPVLLEVRAGARILAPRKTSDARGSIQLDEWDLDLGLRGILAPIALGIGIDLELRFLSALGVTPGGAAGDRRTLLPALTGSIEARVPVWKAVSARVSLGVGLPLRHQKFAINEEPILDLGRWRILLQLSLAVALF